MELLAKYSWAIGAALSPFAALLFIFIARVIIKLIDPYIPNFMRKILFFRW